MSYHNLLTIIQNAQAARKKSVKMPFSKMNLAISEVLVKNKFLDSVEVRGRQSNKKTLEIVLSDSQQINDAEFISKPSRRLYIGYKEIRSVKGGFGLLILSTPKGILSGQEAKKQKIGGEMLFKIW